MKKKSKVKYFYNFSPFLGINVSTNRMQIQGYYISILVQGGRRGPGRIVDEFTTTCAISAYHH